MKKIIPILLLFLSSQMIAQQYTTHSIGYMGAQQTASGDQGNVTVGVSGGNVFFDSQFHTLLQDKVQTTIGFPAMVSYFPRVFDNELFISKGYFSDYVQLSWNIVGQQGRIERIKVFRKILGSESDSLLVASIAADNFTYRDEYAEKGVLYEYTIFADGIANALRIPGINYMQGVGFAFPFGTAAGRVTFEGGTAVQGVQILAETDGNLGGKSLWFNGTDAYLSVNHAPDHTELELRNGFSVQLWALFEGSSVGTLFSKGDQYNLSYDGAQLSFTVNDVTLDMPYANPADYFHVTATYDVAGGLSLYVQENDETIESAFAAAPTQPNESVDEILFGQSALQADYFQGYMDELRIWKKALTEQEAKGNFSRYLSGSEVGLSGYWKLNAGIGGGFYDFSRQGFDFNENHGTIFRANWSLNIPSQNQLAYRGVTDANGNYVVKGFPYETAGSQYTFTPIFGVHSFEPTQQLRYVGDGSSIFNGIDFDDVSSFPVSGTVKYRNSYFPVQGVSILIDGNPATNSEGQIIVTDNTGQFTVDVPIGEHSLRMSKSGHVFEGEGRFPPPAFEGNIPTYDYQEPLSGLIFVDSTLVKLSGRVAGGPIESEKPLGFGLSNNNIGIAEIHLTSEKGFDISASTFDAGNPDSTQIYDERDIVSRTEFDANVLTIFPDETTGEFVTYLPPEKYVVTAVGAGTYVFGNEHMVSINLEQSFLQEETYEEVVKAVVNGAELPGYSPYNVEDFDYFNTQEIGDTTFTIGGRIFDYQMRKDFILRVKPEIEVVNADGLEVFGESVYHYEDDLIEEDIPLIDEFDAYTFGYPVFFQQSRYNMFISVFEEYVNDDTNETDRVPVKDGEIEIENDFAIDPGVRILPLNEKGKVRYEFGGGSPSFTVNGAESFTKPFSLTAVTGETGNIRTIWRESDPLRGIVFGGRPQGNNFVTTGPNQIITILRDPPGSNSFAFLEQGNSITNTVTWGSQITQESEAKAKISLGPDVETSFGIGTETTFDVDVTADLELGLQLTSEYTALGETQNTITSTKTWTTSSNSKFVNSSGDVFVGHSTNIVYGASTSVQPIPTGASECVPPNSCGTTEYNGFALGQRSKLRLNPTFGTMFIYTQSHIENVLIPDLIDIRNSLLIYSADPGSVVAVDEPIYVSLVEASDERFGSANYSIADWGDEANVDIGVGPSYQIVIPDGYDLNLVGDTIAYFNKQIEGWVRTLEDNERVKVQAQLSENISFDGGTSFSSSETVESASSQSYDFNVGINKEMAIAAGLTVNGVGAEVNLSQSISMGSSGGGGTQVSNSTTYGYTLADDESAGATSDFYSIDVKTPSDGFGPVFVTRAGVTSCPYEGDEKTKYYQPGEHTLNFATIQVERPDISIVNPLVANVPSTRQAEIMLELKNESENSSGVIYNLSVDDQSNPNGAVLSIDGSVLTGDSRGIFIPAGQVVSKILKVSKGSDDINDYENIVLKLSSQCDSKISDSQSFSVYFQPACSEINLVSPVDLWTVNTNTVPVGTQNIVFDEYDVQNSQFKYVKFQYKSTSSSQWLTNMIFYNPMLITSEEYDLLDEPKSWLDASGSTLYPWDMSAMPDREYDVQVVTVCEIAPGVTVETPSETHTGIKDTKRPIAFGAPQPADGILSANDEILIQFDETIEAGLLTPFNFSVKGVLNSTSINHNSSISMDGTSDYVKVSEGLNLSSRSFTVEFWINRKNFSKEQVLYSKGYSANDAMEFGFTASNEFFIDFPGQRITSLGTYAETGWNHFAVVYSNEGKTISVFKNDQVIIDTQQVTATFTGNGAIAIGKSLIGNDRHYEGNIHDFRIWDKSRQLGDVYAKMSSTLTGSEVGLIGYWRMDEATGSSAFDLARYRHAAVFASWEVSPAGRSYAFDGVDDYLEIGTGSTVVITKEMDYTIEFWFKGNPGQTNAVMFSSGKGDGTDVYNNPANSLSIGFDGSGNLYYQNNGQKIQVSGDYLDDNWHHLAFTLLRQSNASIIVDGVQKKSAVSSNFGGLSGAAMWIGARGYQLNEVDLVFDHHFSGMIDDFRIWNLAKRLEQVKINKNARLVGDEIGLVAYYPFESYETVSGVKIMTTTLDDQWMNPYGENAGSATSNGGADFSDITPNIKDARPVQNVDFDWAVNNDAIIITPSPSFTPLIEQTVLEITVQNIQDKNENRLASPITWTAFVDKNQLKWGSDQFIATKEIYQPYTFTVDVVNHGGTETNYSIENLPRWLSVNAQTGVLAPASVKTIQFTVDEGLNTGYYREDIFLSSDFGFDEKLSIDLSVLSPAPDWNTDPRDFEFSMNLIAKVEILGVTSSDINDRVAAFVGDEIRGDADLVYLQQLDAYLVFLDIFSNVESGETVELRVWDADKGVEYRNALPIVSFTSNDIIGSPTVPETIEAGLNLTQLVALEKGWNWTSFNVDSEQLVDLNVLMSGVSSATGDQVKGIDKVDIYTAGIGWAGTLSSSGGLQNGAMYLMKTSGSEDLTVIGQKLDPNLSISITTGWNWLGFVPRFNMSVNEAFAFFNPTTGDVVKGQSAFAVYDESLGWIGSLKNMEPGKGYLFRSTNAGTFSYPEATGLGARRSDAADVISDYMTLDRHKYPYNMSVIAELDAVSSMNFVLIASHNGELRGVMEPIQMSDETVRYFMTIHGEVAGEELDFQAIDTQTAQVYYLDQTVMFNASEPLGTLAEPLRLTGVSRVTGINHGLSQIEVYPNPFREALSVRIPNVDGLKPSVQLYDIMGKLIKPLVVTGDGSDWITELRDSDISLQPGIYLLKVDQGQKMDVLRVIKY